MLETFRPEVVLMMVGSNDFWTAPVPPDEAPTFPRRGAIHGTPAP